MRLLRFALSLLLATASGSSLAADIKLRDTPYSLHDSVKVIELSGPIVAGDAQKLADLFAESIKCEDMGIDCSPYSAVIALASPGGDYQEGQRLAEFLRDKAIASVVESGESCLSACAVAFLGGSGFWPTGGVGPFIARFVEPGARVGFHAPFLPQADAQEIAKSNLPLVMDTSRLDTAQLAKILNTYYVDPAVTDRIISKGPEETYDITTVEDLMLFHANLPYFPPALVSLPLPEKVRNVCLKLLAVHNSQPVDHFAGDYLASELQRSDHMTSEHEAVFGFAIADRPLNIDWCGFTGNDTSDPLGNGSIQLFRMQWSKDGSEAYEEPFLWFYNEEEGWSSAAYHEQDATRSILSFAPLNYWMYDAKLPITEAAKDFGDWLKRERAPLALSQDDVQVGYLQAAAAKPSGDFGNHRTYMIDNVLVDQSIWPVEMYDDLQKVTFARRKGFAITYSKNFANAFVATGPDTETQNDVYILGMRSDRGAVVLTLKANWDQSTSESSAAQKRATEAIACSARLGDTHLPCYR